MMMIQQFFVVCLSILLNGQTWKLDTYGGAFIYKKAVKGDICSSKQVWKDGQLWKEKIHWDTFNGYPPCIRITYMQNKRMNTKNRKTWWWPGLVKKPVEIPKGKWQYNKKKVNAGFYWLSRDFLLWKIVSRKEEMVWCW